MPGAVTLQSGTRSLLLQPRLAAEGTMQCGSWQVTGAAYWTLDPRATGAHEGGGVENQQGNSPRPPIASATHSWGTGRDRGRSQGGPLGKPQNPALENLRASHS